MRTSIEEDDKATRVKALEDMVRLGQMDQSAFERLRDEIVGGHIQNVHLVKGLDRKLLERVRKGEDVLSETPENSSEGLATSVETPIAQAEDVDQELAELEDKEITPIHKEEKAKKGEMAPPPPIAGKKRTRDEILAEFRASRLASAKPFEPTLSTKFTKIGQSKQKSRIQRDERGREVLITMDEEGNVKRKVKKSTSNMDDGKRGGLLMPDKDTAPLGMEVIPQHQVATEADDDDDIFEDAGADYDPLAGLSGDDDDSQDDSQDEGQESDAEAKSEQASPPTESTHDKANNSKDGDMPPPSIKAKSRNYFTQSNSAPQIESLSADPISLTKDPSLLAALKKASAIASAANPEFSSEKSTSAEGDATKLARRRAMLSAQDRDAQDLDMGFGASQFGEDADEDGDGDGKRVKLSQWMGEDGDDEANAKGDKGGKQRKRGKKKRKGDKDSAADVLRVMEARKAG